VRNLKDVLDLLGLVGGAGAIIIGIASFTSKLWADWFMKKKTAEYDKQMEHYKSILELERERYIALNEQIVYKNKILFDTEFEIYKEITPKLISTVDAFTNWIIFQKLSRESLDKLQQQYQDMNYSITKYASFIDEVMYKCLNDFRLYIAEKIMKYSDAGYSYNYVELRDVDLEILSNLDGFFIISREYLRNLAKLK
jgi:hypothetical protein